MQKSTNNSDQGLTDTEIVQTEFPETDVFLRQNFVELVIQSYGMGDITEDMKNTLLSLKPIDLDELDDAYRQLVHAIQNKQYYQILARVEKAESVIAEETDIAKKDRYIKVMHELISKMEELKPV